MSPADVAAMRALPEKLRDEYETAMLAENDLANLRLAEISSLIAETERALAQLRCERVKQIAIADFTMAKAIEHNKARKVSA